MKFWIVACLILGLVPVTPAKADLQTARMTLPDAELVGQGRLKVLLWNVFDASLYAPAGKFAEDKPFALSLSYLRDLSGASIVDKSIEEIKRQGMTDEATLQRWNDAMSAIFPDVDDQTTITGVADEQGHTQFFRNGEPIGRVEDPAFSRYFFNIWLGEETSQPDLRTQLLGDPAL